MWTLILSLGSWNWFILAAVLLLLEVMAPGTFMLWLGLSATLVGLISLAVDWSWQYQLVAFAAFSLAAIPLWRRVGKHAKGPTDQPFLNRRADAFVARSSPWKSRSSPAAAPSASATRCGGSAVRTAPRAARSRSRPSTARR